MDVPVPEDLAILIGGLVLTLAYLALGYYLGRDALGPDANWWGPLRRTLIPRLDRVLSERGMYAENRALDAEFVGFVPETPEAVEEYLYERGYLWNFAAGLKENPDGVVEYSSWARRQVRDPRLRRAFASLGILAYQNRREISRLKDAIFGHDRAADGGMDSEVESLGGTLNRIENKIDEEQRERHQDHLRMQQEVETNRYLVIASVNGLAEAISEDSDIDIDPDDVRPDWIGSEMDPFEDDRWSGPDSD